MIKSLEKMKNLSKKQRKIAERVIFFLITFTWLLCFSPRDGLWYDECFTLFHSQGTIESIIKVSTWDSNPPIFIFVTKVWLKLIGYSEFKIRLLSVIFSSFFISTCTIWVKNYFGRTTSFFLFSFLISSEVFIEYAHEARGYSMLFFLIILNSILTIKLIQKPQIYLGILIGIINTIVFFTHYIEGIIVLIQGVFILIVFLSKDFTLKNKFKIFFYYALGACIFLYYVNKWKILFLGLLENGGNNIFPPPTFSDIPRVFYELLNHSVLFMITITALFLYGTYQFVVRYKSLDQSKKWTLLYLIVFLVLSFLSIYIISFKAPMFCRRYLMFTVFAILIICSVLLNELKTSTYKYVAFVFLMITFNLNHNFLPEKKMHVKDAVSYIQKNKTKNSLIIIQSKDIISNFTLYYNYAIFKRYFFLEEQLIKENVVAVNENNTFLKEINLKNYDKVFLFQVFENVVDPNKTVLNYLNFKLHQSNKIKHLKGITITIYNSADFKSIKDSPDKKGEVLKLNYYKQKIYLDSKWLIHVKNKSKSQNISLDSALTNESLWLISEEDKFFKKQI
jgi:uncharacterized membrane protein